MQPPPPPENGHFFAPKWPFLAQKWPKNAIFAPKTVFFWARVVNSTPLHPILQVFHQNNMCCRVRNQKKG